MAVDMVGVPAGSNPDFRSDTATPVLSEAQSHFAGATPMYDVVQGPRSLDVEPSFEERVEANRQFEAARLQNLARLGIEVSPAKPFQYVDAKVTDVPAVEYLDFVEDEITEDGELAEDDIPDMSVDLDAFPDAVPVPVEDTPKRGRPRKN